MLSSLPFGNPTRLSTADTGGGGGARSPLLLREARALAQMRMRALLGGLSPAFLKVQPGDIEAMLRSEGMLRRRIDGMSTLARVGAVEILALTDGLPVVGIENEELNRRIDIAEARGRVGDPEIQDLIFREREKLTLIIARHRKEGKKSRVIYDVHGLDHDFTDNIAARNAEPDQDIIYAQLIITPESVHGEDERRTKISHHSSFVDAIARRNE